MSKTRVLFLVGGRSGEHEVSLISGKHILNSLDRGRFEPLLIIIQKDGSMTWGDLNLLSKISDNPRNVETPKGPVVAIRPFRAEGRGPAVVVGSTMEVFDIAFPILHGPGGEDGTIQGLFEFAGIPVVGSGVKASAICMDKAFTKHICKAAGLPIVPFVEFYRGQKVSKLDWPFPVFVKPATLGSSLGVSKVKSADALQRAVDEAFSMDEKILIEPGIEGREIEIAVFGNRQKTVASPAGEIRCRTEFYSYEAKYVDPDAAELILPTKLEAQELKKVQDLACRVFNAVECSGMARIDFFMTKAGDFLLNEVNTIPGFTPISMYPKLMGLAGMPYAELLERLIELALKRA